MRFLIPESEQIHLQLKELSEYAKIIVFAGLPGTGKSLYINHFYQIAKHNGQQAQVIQWDVARKEFEKEELNSIFPMNAGQVHPGVRLSAGFWVLNFIKHWAKNNLDKGSNILMIEAPLVGNRFSELCHKQEQEDVELEQLLSSDKVQFVLAVPNEKVREKIEADRVQQISESAKVWSGAKPSVMIQLWKDTLVIAKEFGLTSSQDESYRSDIYKDTYARILQHRQTNILNVDKVFDVQIHDESVLHSLENEIPTVVEVIAAVRYTKQAYPTEKEMIRKVKIWYKS